MNIELIQRAVATFSQVADPTRLFFTDEEIDTYVDKLLPLFPGVSRDEYKLAIQANYSTQIEPFRILEGRERRKHWLKDYKANHRDWPFWSRYKYYLQNVQHFTPSVLTELDNLTDNILDNLFNPKQRHIQISKKGLVVGQVQSGKTANYTGLICKAADAGFNFIIVLAGLHNNLRSQTQVRLDEGFLGFDTEFDRVCRVGTNKKGVGKIPGFDTAIANSYTTSKEKGDFTTRAANAAGFNFDIEYPSILVVKKNASVLRRLSNWLNIHNEQGHDKLENKSLLLIDDEADNASINTKTDSDSPSAINGLICDILQKFNRTAYVGYTATPFANIFIDQDCPEDLFPRDFIINLHAPSNYIGPERVFAISINPEYEKDVLPIVRIINDYKQFVPDKHKKDDPLPTFDDIPESLKKAVKSFILTCAVRIARGQEKKHNSMLIHITRYQIWQNHIKSLIEDLFRYFKAEIEANDKTFMQSMKDLYFEDFVPTSQYIYDIREELNDYVIEKKTWEEVEPLIWKAVQKIIVMSINGSSSDALTYEDNKENGISVIAIGGDKLSRGLTLEGLSISYFLRASKMYDTLMQMGRWFGYRPGYVDLCRLYTSDELNSWYQHIAIASNELRAEFDYMADLHETPDNFALKVRNHDGLLQITSLCKMRNATKIQVSWAGKLVEAYRLFSDLSHKHHNTIVTSNFLSSIGDICHIEKPNNGREKRGYYLWKGVAASDICKFLRSFQLPESNVNLDMISKYIEELSEKHDELTDWNVALMTKNTNSPSLIGQYSVGAFLRSRNDNQDSSLYCLRKNHILGSSMDEFVDIEWSEPDKIKEALEQTKLRHSDWSHDYPESRILREEYRDHKKPLLLLYPLDPKGCYFYQPQNAEPIEIIPTEQQNAEPFISFAISFPKSDSGVAISYATNQPTEYITAEEEYETYNDNQYDDK